MRRLLFISSIFLLAGSYAQDLDSLAMDSVTVEVASPVDSIPIVSDSVSVENPEDTVVRRFLTIAPYLDIGKALTIPTDFETKYEAGLELRFFERYSLYAEGGSTSTKPREAFTNGTYESSGTYYRVGAGYYGPFDLEHNVGFSFRYAEATFDEESQLLISSPSQGQTDLERTITRSDLTAQWWEIVFYSDQKLLENSDLLWLGFNFRLRILNRYDQQETPDVYAIPGYGRSFDKTIPAFNFFLKIQF